MSSRMTVTTGLAVAAPPRHYSPFRTRPADDAARRQSAESQPDREGNRSAQAHQSRGDHQTQGLQEDADEVEDPQTDEAGQVPHRCQDSERRR